MSEPPPIPTSPGLSLQALYGLIKPDALKRLIGSTTVDVLEQLDPTLVNPDKLASLAVRLLDPEATIKDEAQPAPPGKGPRAGR